MRPTDFSDFVASVQRDLPEVAVDRRDEEVAALGERTCAGLRSGKKSATVVNEIRAQGVPDPQARQLLALARVTACP
ncbi:DUF732 domain-containing protein [Paractinoplanes deccanensis]|uniref:DUF732 domain-containing protein n=1 Tax=Paractinoplanes deccanensis TaxID=113561 RepID=UPI001EF2B6A1|nr:DUF732 domain-containing protein [Actinoplanes deccanensis]